MEDFTSLRQYLALEEEGRSAAPRSASDRVLLEEAAEFGRALLQKNEELQQENEVLRTQRRMSVMSSTSDVSQDFTGLDEASAPAAGARQRHPSSASVQAAEGQVPAASRLSSRRHSDVSLLAKEYDHDMEGLIEENGKLKQESSKLERSNRELNAMVQELSAQKSGLSGDESGLSDEAAYMRRHSSRRSNVRKVSFSTSLDDGTEGPDVMDELDAARAQTWSLQQELEAARKESSKLQQEVEALTSECREQQGELEARGDEVESLHSQLLEVSDLIQQQRWLSGGAAEALLHAQQSPGGRGRAFRRGEKGAASLARDLQTAFAAAAGSDCTGEESVAEASAAQCSPPSPSFQFFGAGAAAVSRQTQRRLSEESRELEEQRQQLSELQAQLASSESAEKEACETAARHRDSAKRARQDGEREAKELRQRLLHLEAASAGTGLGEAAMAPQAASSQKERELLKKNEKLRRSLQAETKNREVIEAELMRTLMMMRKLDCELF